MKKIFALLMTVVMGVSLVACGTGSEDAEKAAPDLTAYFDSLMEELGETAPMTMALEGDMLETTYPGITDYTLTQSVFEAAAISAVAFELALVEVSDEADVEAVKGIFESRIDSQIEGGAFYPATVEAWQNAEVIVNGNVVALIAAGESQTTAVDSFNALFA